MTWIARSLFTINAVLLLAACGDDDCYSPQHTGGDQGCACNPKVDQDVCLDGSRALVCDDGHWQTALDGPCLPDSGVPDGGFEDTVCFSPTQNTRRAYDPSAHGCACNPTTDHDACVNGAALVCMDHQWSAVEDGPCASQSSSDSDAGSDQRF